MKKFYSMLFSSMFGLFLFSEALACDLIPIPSDAMKLGAPFTVKSHVIQEYDRDADGIADMAIGFAIEEKSKSHSQWPVLYFLGSESKHVRMKDIGASGPMGRCEDIIIDPTFYTIKDFI